MNISQLVKISDCLWEIPKETRHDMRVPARVYASEELIKEILRDKSLEQLINVATLPGIYRYALAMPDIHEGYGFPVGGVAAFDAESGIISPGGIGYDINCGVRLLKSDKTYDEVKKYISRLSDELYRDIPSGVGKGGWLRLHGNEFKSVLENGARRIVEMGYGDAQDLSCIESGGVLDEASADFVSREALSRGRDQLGTMGAGNHFVEVGVVEKILDETEARKLDLFAGQITILIHTGSRGLGHQIATDYIRLMMKVMPRYGIEPPDRELACAPFKSKEGQDYFRAMCAAANFAWANRQLITWEVRKTWEKIFGDAGKELEVVYDVAHNIAKVEHYNANDAKVDANGAKSVLMVVHRKGATRAFPGQPVLIPGSMGTFSYVLAGQEESLLQSFGSTCHGAGRRMSRTQAKRQISGAELKIKLENAGVHIRAGSVSGIAEEAPEAYKDVNSVVDVVAQAGIAKKVARLRPIAVVKG